MAAFHPDYAFPPGEHIAERLEELGLDPAEALSAIGDERHVARLLVGEEPLDEAAAEVAHAVTGMPARLLLKLEHSYRRDRLHRAMTCCHRCRDEASAGLDPLQQMSLMRMLLCPQCGNKRCPKANDHGHSCTGSNQPGQAGSAYP